MDAQAARAEALAAQERAQQSLPLSELSPEEFLPVSPATAADVTGSGIGQDRSVLAAANPAAAGLAAVPTVDFQQRREAGNMAPAAPVRKFKLGSRPDGVPDVLDAIQELGGIGGPMLGSLLISTGMKLDSIFYVLAGIGLFGVLLSLLVPMSRSAAGR